MSTALPGPVRRSLATQGRCPRAGSGGPRPRPRRPGRVEALGRERLEPDLAAGHRHERAGGRLDPGPAVEVSDPVDLGGQGKVGVAAGHEPITLTPGILDGPLLDELAVPLPLLGDPPDPAGRPVRGPLLDAVEDPAGDVGQQLVVG